MFGRRRFATVVDAQLDLFRREHGDAITEAAELLAAYDRAGRDEAEERYGDYVDSVDAGRDILEVMRDHYAATLDEPEEYVREFNRAVSRRLPQFSFDREE
jgi:hypothetical protein